MTHRPTLTATTRSLLLAPGIVSFGLLFGAEAAAHGFTPASIGIFSLTVFAGAMQFAVLALLRDGAIPLAAIGLVALMNLRYLLLAIAALEFAREARMTRPWRIALALGVVEESYAVQASLRRDAQPDRSALLMVPLVLGTIWVSSSMAGYWLRSWLPPFEEWGLDYALPGIFVGLFGLFATDPSKVRAGLVALVAGGLLGVMGQTVLAALAVPPVVAYLASRPDQGGVPA